LDLDYIWTGSIISLCAFYGEVIFKSIQPIFTKATTQNLNQHTLLRFENDKECIKGLSPQFFLRLVAILIFRAVFSVQARTTQAIVLRRVQTRLSKSSQVSKK
ncbi:hypothetical protein KCU67_g97, partial [Aureobasidium melanogenum]